MDKKILYGKAYRELEVLTPLKFDCGMLCNGKCCTGDSDAGMCLYPGEEVMLEKHGGFLALRKEGLLGKDVLFASCEGTCDRKYRPLACRIFPYAPYFDGDGRLSIIEDSRAKYLCPLLMESFEFEVDRLFVRKVRDVFRFLVRDDEIRDHVQKLSHIMEEYRRFV